MKPAEYHNPAIGRRPEYRRAVEEIRASRATAAARGVPFSVWAAARNATAKGSKTASASI